MKKDENSIKSVKPLKGLHSKLAFVQNEMPALQKSAIATVVTKQGGTFQYKYVTLDQILEKLLPLCQEVGIVFYQYPIDGCLETIVADIENPDDKISCRIPLIGINDKSTMQQIGSSLTYSRRYSLSCIFELACDFDDDAKLASEPRGPGFPNAPASEKQINYIKVLAEKTNTKISDIIAHYEVGTLEDLSTTLAGEVINALQVKQYQVNRKSS